MVTFYNNFVKCGARATVADVAGQWHEDIYPLRRIGLAGPKMPKHILPSSLTLLLLPMPPI